MFGRNSKVNLELNREVEKLIKTGGKEQLLPIVQAGEPVLRQQTAAYEGQLSRKTLDKLIETIALTMIRSAGRGPCRNPDRSWTGPRRGGRPCA